MIKDEALRNAKPILFNTAMVEAIQNGTKTVTRRVIKPRFRENECGFFTATIAGQLFLCYSDEDDNETRRVKSPYQVGDILYVRETWSPVSVNPKRYLYKTHCTEADNLPVKWHPSIHMPKEAARIFLRVTGVCAERLQDAFFKSGSTILSLLREGFDMHEQCREDIDVFYGSPHCRDGKNECSILSKVRGNFSDLWDSTVKESDIYKYGWAANPWVWVIEFERIEVTG